MSGGKRFIGILAAGFLSPLAGLAADGDRAPLPLERRAVAGGWFLEGAERVELGAPVLDASGGRFAVPAIRWNAEQTGIEWSALVISESAGDRRRVLDLGRALPVEWKITADGRAAAALVQDLEAVDARATLLVWDLVRGGEPVRQSVDLDTRLVAGRTTFALAGLPSWTPGDELEAIEETDFGGPSSEGRMADLHSDVSTFPAQPVSFVRASGDRVPPRAALAGEVAPLRVAGGFVAFGRGKLTRVDEHLRKTWEVHVGFEGPVAASDDGSLIVVADHTPGRLSRRVLAFGPDGTRRAEVSVDAPLAVDLAVAPDGAGFLVAAAALVSPMQAKYDGHDRRTLRCHAANGTLLWSVSRPRDVVSRRFAQLTLSNGAAFASTGWVADEEGALPEILVIGAAGSVVYRTEGFFDAVGLDPTGAYLWTLEEAMLSRLSLAALVKGRALAKN